ncbi:MAG: chemotaxis-specific protein-glutamate methyltransferase CheB [Brevinematales bacterium]|nr:chemotaxis-specific protein-glutamate methyltransferase CheB [Brevinematales bacterium]
MIKVLLVDDSPIVHRLLETVAQKHFPGQYHFVHATNGEEGVKQSLQENPDLIIMDIEMPVMDGLAATRHIMQQNPKPIIVFSAATTKIANLVMLSLEAGAVDVIEKPNDLSSTEVENYLRQTLFQRMKIFYGFKVIKRFNPETVQRLAIEQEKLKHIAEKKKASSHTYPIVGIASSTGGPQTLKRILSQLRKTSYPIIIIQHIPRGFIEGFREWLLKATQLECDFARENTLPQPGVVYVVNEDKHLSFNTRGEFSFIEKPPIFGIRPAADYFFDALGEVYKERAIGIVLTGMGEDGCKGAEKIKAKGGTIIAEAEEDCIVFGMPKAVIEANLVDKVMKIDEIVNFLNGLSQHF